MNEAGARILVVDDEKAIRRFLRAALSTHGYVILEAVDGGEALRAAAEQHPDLILLDLMLPDMNGFEITRRLREWSSVPIIILTVREAEEDKIQALDSGADDYLTKPFGIGELMARIRVALRHNMATEKQEQIFQSGELKVDFIRRLVWVNDQEVSLTPTEYDILKLMVQNAGKVLTHQQIIRKVWGAAYTEEAHLLRVNISNLRRKIEPDPTRPQWIVTEPGVGYRLKA